MPQIEGIPVGTRIKRVGTAYEGDWYVGKGLQLRQGLKGGTGYGAYVIVEPDNVYNEVDLTKVPVPEGYERAGEKVEEWFREPLHDEINITDPRSTKRLNNGLYFSYWEGRPFDYKDPRRIILRKIQPKTKKVWVIELENPTQSDYSHMSQLSTHHKRVEERPL